MLGGGDGINTEENQEKPLQTIVTTPLLTAEKTQHNSQFKKEMYKGILKSNLNTVGKDNGLGPFPKSRNSRDLIQCLKEHYNVCTS